MKKIKKEIICGIYQIKNLVNDKIYIGSSVNINKRLIEHKSELNNNKHFNIYLQRSYNKYGIDNFEYTILLIMESETFNDLRDETELWYIYNSNAEYNISTSSLINGFYKWNNNSMIKIPIIVTDSYNNIINYESKKECYTSLGISNIYLNKMLKTPKYHEINDNKYMFKLGKCDVNYHDKSHKPTIISDIIPLKITNMYNGEIVYYKSITSAHKLSDISMRQISKSLRHKVIIISKSIKYKIEFQNDTSNFDYKYIKNKTTGFKIKRININTNEMIIYDSVIKCYLNNNMTHGDLINHIKYKIYYHINDDTYRFKITNYDADKHNIYTYSIKPSHAIKATNITTNEIIIYKNISDCAKKININRKAVASGIKDREIKIILSQKYDAYRFEYYDDIYDGVYSPNKRFIKIKRININDNTTKIYNTKKECHKDNNLNQQSLNKLIKSHSQYNFNNTIYIFELLDENVVDCTVSVCIPPTQPTNQIKKSHPIFDI